MAAEFLPFIVFLLDGFRTSFTVGYGVPNASEPTLAVRAYSRITDMNY